jgi:hypothetical protein
MKKIAVEQARSRFEKAQSAILAMEQSKDFSAAETAWSDFLLATSAVYSKLEQGAKGSGSSEGWFGRKKHDRRTDPLLSYIHHARNADEHGIEPVTERKEGSLKIGGGGAYRFDGTVGEQTDLTVTHLAGPPPIVKIELPHVKLVTVKDSRYGDNFDPPTKHLGEEVRDQSPLNVAKLALSYLESLLAEAAELTE